MCKFYFNELDQSELDIFWYEEALKQSERIRRTDEADGYYQQEDEDEQR